MNTPGNNASPAPNEPSSSPTCEPPLTSHPARPPPQPDTREPTAVVRDIQDRGARDHHSALLDRLVDYVGISEAELGIPALHRALAKTDAVARNMGESRSDAKRFFARLVYPHIFDLASLEAGKSHDIAADVLNQSVSQIVEAIRVVSESLAAYTAAEPNLRESLPLVVGGNIAANPLYDQRLGVQINSNCRYISSVDAIGSASTSVAALAPSYLTSRDRSAAVDVIHTEGAVDSRRAGLKIALCRPFFLGAQYPQSTRGSADGLGHCQALSGCAHLETNQPTAPVSGS